MKCRRRMYYLQLKRAKVLEESQRGPERSVVVPDPSNLQRS